MLVMADCCSICFQPISNTTRSGCVRLHSDVIKLSCGHCFHYKCLANWLIRNKNTCPYCRKEINNKRNILLDMHYMSIDEFLYLINVHKIIVVSNSIKLSTYIFNQMNKGIFYIDLDNIEIN